MTSNQIAYGQLLVDQRRAEIAEEGNRLTASYNDEVKRHNEKNEELEAFAQEIQKEIANNNKRLEERRLEIQADYNRQYLEIERTEANVKTLEAITKQQLADAEAEWKYWDSYWSGVRASNETLQTQENVRHDKETESFIKVQNELREREVANEEAKVAYQNKYLEFEKTKWNEEFSLKGNIFEWNKQVDSSKINLEWANIGLGQRKNNIEYEKFLLDQQKFNWQSQWTEHSFRSEQVRKWYETGATLGVKVLDLFSPF